MARDAAVQADGAQVTASRDVKPSAGCETGKGFKRGNGLVRYVFVDSLYLFECV